jgi:hypothetical protein
MDGKYTQVIYRFGTIFCVCVCVVGGGGGWGVFRIE